MQKYTFYLSIKLHRCINESWWSVIDVQRSSFKSVLVQLLYPSFWREGKRYICSWDYTLPVRGNEWKTETVNPRCSLPVRFSLKSKHFRGRKIKHPKLVKMFEKCSTFFGITWAIRQPQGIWLTLITTSACILKDSYWVFWQLSITI